MHRLFTQRNQRGLAISRGLLLFIAFLAAIIFVIFWGIPWAKQYLVSSSLEITCNVYNPEDDPAVEHRGEIVSKTVASLELLFPMGSAPDTENELQVWDTNTNQRVDVYWQEITKEDLEDRGITRWYIKEVYFPYRFRDGLLKTRHRDLVKFQLKDVKALTAE